MATYAPAVVLLAVFGLLWLPTSVSRDAALCGVAASLVLFAMFQFPSAWMGALLLLPILQLEVMPFRLNAAVSLPRVLFVGFLLAFLATQRTHRRFWSELRHSYGLIGLVLFLGASLLSAAYAMSTDALERALTYIEPVLVYLFSYYAISRNPQQRRKFFRVLSVSTLVVFVLGIAEVVMQESPLLLAGVRQMYDPTQRFEAEDRMGLGRRLALVVGHPVFAGQYIIIATIIAIYYCRMYKPRTARVRIATLIPVAGFLLLATGTRVAFLAACAAGIFSAVLHRSRVKALLTTTIAAGILLWVAYEAVPQLWIYVQKSANFTQDQTESANIVGRISLTSSLFDIFEAHPWFGMGPGHVQHQSFRGGTEYSGLSGLENQYAVILADSGIIGGLAYLLFMLGAVLDGIMMLHSTRRDVHIGGFTVLLLLVAHFTFTIGASAFSLLPTWLLFAAYGAIDAHRRLAPAGVLNNCRPLLSPNMPTLIALSGAEK